LSQNLSARLTTLPRINSRVLRPDANLIYILDKNVNKEQDAYSKRSLMPFFIANLLLNGEMRISNTY
ncbi:MAG TPA: hypothetical protein VFG02_05385, partial [Nitrospirota bacterium]|nr:hypothetical protein [Nitrospirota bacterium]